VTVIAEEFGPGPIRLAHICDVLEGSIIKRRALGRGDGVAILAEGLAEQIDPRDLNEIEELERDAHGNIRYSEIPLGTILKNRVRRRLRERGISVTVVDKNIGYELRCAPPIPYDCEYTQDLGYSAVRFLLSGDTGAMISIQSGQLVPLYLSDMLDRETGRTRVRMVDIATEYYEVARNYMLRIEREDFENPRWTARLARAAQLSTEDFEKRFRYLTEI
jgi:6-phosphofructokinase